MKFFTLFLFITDMLFSKTCTKSEILGVFPQITGMTCSDYALMIAFTSIISAYLFWDNVTK